MAQRVTMLISYQKKFPPDAHMVCLASPMFLTNCHKEYMLNSKTVQSIHLSQQVVTANPTHETLWCPAHRADMQYSPSGSPQRVH